MSQMTGITTANQALAAEDLDGDLFEVVGGKVTGKKFTAPVPAGLPALVPSPDRSLLDLNDPGDGQGGFATPDNAVLNADGTWKIPPQTRTRLSLGYPQNLPPTVSAGQNGITQNFPAAIAGQQFYTPQLTIDEQASVPLPIPIYPVLAAGAQPATSGAYGLLPVAGALAGRPDVVFTSDGKWRVLPTAPAPTNTLVYDAIGKTITSTVSGVVSTTSLASLDDEGVSLSFAAGSLQLKNSAGTVLSTTPVPDLDAQTLTLTGQTLAISGGNSVTLPAAPTPADFFSSVTATADTIGLPNGVTDRTESIRRDGKLGIFVDPKLALHTTSFGAAVSQSYSSSAATVSTPNDHTLRMPGGTFGWQLHDPLTTPGQILYLVNANSGPEPLSVAVGNSGIIDAAAQPVTSLPAAESITVQAMGQYWIVIDRMQKPAAVPATTVSNTVSGSGTTRILTTTVNGVTSAAVDISDKDMQALSIAGNVITLTNGGSVTLPAAPATTNTLTYFPATGSGGAALGSTVNGVLSTVPIAAIVSCTNISDAFTTAPAAPTAASVILGKNCQSFTLAQLSAAIVPPTTNTAVWTQAGGLVETVNGVASTVAIPAGVPTQMLGYDAAGKPVYQAIKKYVTLEAAAWGTVGANSVVGQQYYGIDAAQSTPFVDVYTYDAFLTITGAGSPFTLVNPPANLSALMVGREVTVKLMGPWVGTQVVNGNIDGATSYSFTKAAATGVNAFPARTFKWTGSNWLVV
jgi:hypothetical protein